MKTMEMFRTWDKWDIQRNTELMYYRLAVIGSVFSIFLLGAI